MVLDRNELNETMQYVVCFACLCFQTHTLKSRQTVQTLQEHGWKKNQQQQKKTTKKTALLTNACRGGGEVGGGGGGMGGCEMEGGREGS